MNSQGMDTVRLIYISEKSSLDPNKFMQRNELIYCMSFLGLPHRYHKQLILTTDIKW